MNNVTNLVSGSLSSDDLTAVQAALATIRAKLPFLHGVDPADRQGLAKLGDKSQAFVAQALQAAQANPGVLPASFDLAEFSRDYALWQAWQPFLVSFAQLSELVDGTAAALGSDLYTEALAVYGYLKVAGRGSGLDELKSALGQRFKRNGGGSGATPPKPA